MALFHGLPAEASYWRKQAGWSDQEELTALLVETVHGWGRINAVIAGAKVSSLPKPLKIPRPNEKSKPSARVVSLGELGKFLGAKDRRTAHGAAKKRRKKPERR